MSHGGSRRAPLSVPDSDVDEIDDDSVDADKHSIRDSDQRRFSVKRIHVAVDCPGPNRSLKRKLSTMSSQEIEEEQKKMEDKKAIILNKLSELMSKQAAFNAEVAQLAARRAQIDACFAQH